MCVCREKPAVADFQEHMHLRGEGGREEEEEEEEEEEKEEEEEENTSYSEHLRDNRAFTRAPSWNKNVFNTVSF